MIKAMDTADIVNRARESAAECVAELERLRNLNRQKAVEIDFLRAKLKRVAEASKRLVIGCEGSWPLPPGRELVFDAKEALESPDGE